MTESILVGLVVGVGVAAVGALVGHCLRLRETKQQWNEEQRRRESERKRDLVERELAVITDFADANMDLWHSVLHWSPTGRFLSPIARAEAGSQAFLMHARANVASLSLGDEKLEEGVKRLIELFDCCNKLADPETGGPRADKRKEFKEALEEMRTVTARIRQRRRELLQEV